MTPEEQNFEDYKKAEAKAIELLGEMEKVSPKKVDIELALITAVYELHRGKLPPATVAKIIQTHLQTLTPFYEQSLEEPNDN